MNVISSHKGFSFIRSFVYLFAFFATILAAFLFPGIGGSDSMDYRSSFRIMTYNIHHGEGIDGKVDIDRIAKVIKKENPDILLLQEVDVNLERSKNTDIPQQLSDSTGLKYVEFGKNLDIGEGKYGNSTLSSFPIISTYNFQFEQIGPEQRGVLATELLVNGRNLLVLNSHFDHSPDDSERVLYAEKIVGEILPEYDTDAVLIGGDFNDIPSSRMYQKLSESFKDAWVVSGHGNGFTIPAGQPSKRIDYILFDGKIKPDSVWVPSTVASDHLPVVTDFVWVDEN